MPTVVRQHNDGNPYKEEFAIPNIPKGNSVPDHIKRLESKIEFLLKIFFEKATKSPNGQEGLYIRKTFTYPKTLQLELIADKFFAPNANVDIRFSIASKTSDFVYFSKKFRVVCNNKGSFPRVLVMATLDLEIPGEYDNARLSAVTVDLTNGSIAYAEDVVI